MLSAATAEAQSLRGGTHVMERQNRIARQHDFTFLQTSAQIQRFVNAGYLQRLEGNEHYELARVSHPVARPAVRLFVERLAAQYYAACGEKLVVTSLTRPVLEQPRNASDLSVHPAGMAVDLRISNSRTCVKWLEKTLLSLEKQGVLDVTRERRPPHYHVALFPEPYERYVTNIAGPAAVRLASAQTSSSTTSKSAENAELEEQLTNALAEDDVAETRLVTANVAPSEEPRLMSYRVNRGDTLWSIARRHGTTVDALKDLNSLDSSRILAGQVLRVPVPAASADDS